MSETIASPTTAKLLPDLHTHRIYPTRTRNPNNHSGSQDWFLFQAELQISGPFPNIPKMIDVVQNERGPQATRRMYYSRRAITSMHSLTENLMMKSLPPTVVRKVRTSIVFSPLRIMSTQGSRMKTRRQVWLMPSAIGWESRGLLMASATGWESARGLHVKHLGLQHLLSVRGNSSMTH